MLHALRARATRARRPDPPSQEVSSGDGAAAGSPEAPSEVVAVEDAPNDEPESDDVAPLSDANPSGTDVSTAATAAAKDDEAQGEDEPRA